jgi:hypothetical protein
MRTDALSIWARLNRTEFGAGDGTPRPLLQRREAMRLVWQLRVEAHLPMNPQRPCDRHFRSPDKSSESYNPRCLGLAYTQSIRGLKPTKLFTILEAKAGH